VSQPASKAVAFTATDIPGRDWKLWRNPGYPEKPSKTN